MPEPGDQVATGREGPGRLRAARADREYVIGVLQTAFVQGRLTKDELDTRLNQALAARTYADLAGLTADIPVGLTPPRRPAQTRSPGREAVVWSIAAMFLAVTLVSSRFLAPLYFLLISGTVIAIMFAAGAQLLYSRHEQRSGGYRSSGPGPQRRTCHQQTLP
jgi:Domain of unknown function (DUF1707)